MKNEEVSNLRAANGTPIPTYGQRLMTLNIGLRKDITWPFVIAKVEQPIIGADLLCYYKLVVDLHNQCLLDTSTNLKARASVAMASDTLNTLGDDPECYRALLQKYKSLTLPNPALQEPKHDVKHIITTTGQPVHTRPRRLNPKVADAAKEAVRVMLQDGIIRPSKSPWASPLHVVPKKSGWRVVGDYRLLNDVTLKDKYSLPPLQDFSAKLAGCTVFSKVDLTSAYFQIPLDEESMAKTAVTTPFGSYEFTRMPYGLCGAAQTFQRFLDTVLRSMRVEGREVILFNYVDDILVASPTETEHLQDLEELFKRLDAHGLIINPLKCEFGRPEINFLGHKITPQGILPLPEKVQAIADFERPTFIKTLRTYCGMIQYYNRFLPNIAQIMAPLNEILSGKPRKNAQINWTPQAIKAFEEAKTALAQATLLHHPDPDLPTAIAVDASSTTVGAVLQQLHNTEWRPLAFFSKKMQPRERKYSTFGRELLAAYLAVKHFKYFVVGIPFTILTDHKPLVGAMRKQHERDIPRESRHLSFLSQFTTDIRHVAGAQNVIADALSRCHDQEEAEGLTTSPDDDDSRPYLSAVFADADEDLLRREQQQDEELQALLANNESSLKLTQIEGIYCHVFNSVCRPYIPQMLRQRYFQRVHDIAHPGTRATLRMVTERFVWPHMKKDIRQWCDDCNSCRRGKITRHNVIPPQTIPPEGGKFAQVHLDLVGPLPPNEGYTYLLTIVDRHTRWQEICPIKDARAETVATAFISTWISRYGCPISVTTDRGPQFESALWSSLMSTFGTLKIRTTAYHPRSNGLIERVHRRIKDGLKTQADPHNWLQKLPLILLSMRAAVKEDIGYSTAELMFGVNLRLPSDLLVRNIDPTLASPTEYTQRLRMFMSEVGPAESRPIQPKEGYLDPKLKCATQVFVRVDRVKRPLEPPYEGPYKVVLRNKDYFKIQRGTRTDSVHVSRLKAAYSEDDLFSEVHKPITVELSENPQSDEIPHIQQPDEIQQPRQEQTNTPESDRPQSLHKQNATNTPSMPTRGILRTRSGRVSRLPVKFRN